MRGELPLTAKIYDEPQLESEGRTHGVPREKPAGRRSAKGKVAKAYDVLLYTRPNKYTGKERTGVEVAGADR